MQLVAVLHVHTTASSGAMHPAQIARAAREAGIDVLLLTENFGYRFRYGHALIRRFVEVTQSTPMLEDFGIDAYLAELRRVQEMNPSPLLFVGIETPPYYYWTGSLLAGDLVLHDMQRNLLVFAPPSSAGRETAAGAGVFPYPAAETRDFIEGLPTAGNRYYRHYGFGSLLLLLPGLVLVIGSWRALARAGVFRPASYAFAYVLDEKKGRYLRRRRSPLGRREIFGTILCAAGATLLYVNFPFSVPRLDPYGADRGYEPFGALIDEVGENNGLVFWSMPEADDYHEFGRAGVRVRLSTESHKDALLETDGYAGFGAVYADNTTATDIGDTWDRALLEYTRGDRNNPPWAVGESAFHFAGQAGKQLDDILTVVLVRERTHHAVFEALANGRVYATQIQRDGADLRLTEFAISGVGVGYEGPVARSGDTLEVSGGEIEVSLRVDEAGEHSVPIQVTIVRDGELYRRIDTVAPFEIAWLETLEQDAPTTYYRVMVRGPGPALIVSNPIFVRDSSGANR
ncbi:MAG: hypothetical protein IH849_01545 [Acidobacteria bacterium]|nr:hypothetical protein [Acidobacteriota bacterium]